MDGLHDWYEGSEKEKEKEAMSWKFPSCDGNVVWISEKGRHRKEDCEEDNWRT